MQFRNLNLTNIPLTFFLYYPISAEWIKAIVLWVPSCSLHNLITLSNKAYYYCQLAVLYPSLNLWRRSTNKIVCSSDPYFVSCLCRMMQRLTLGTKQMSKCLHLVMGVTWQNNICHCLDVLDFGVLKEIDWEKNRLLSVSLKNVWKWKHTFGWMRFFPRSNQQCSVTTMIETQESFNNFVFSAKVKVIIRPNNGDRSLTVCPSYVFA